MKVNKFRRGQIWWYENNSVYNGSIQGKTRPVIIMSNDLANEYSNCLLAIPCTTVDKKFMPTHTNFYIDGTKNIALAENLLSVNTSKLTEYVGTVDNELLELLENNLKVALALVNDSKEEDIKEEDSEEKEVESVVKQGRKPKYTFEQKRKFVKDYEMYGLDYMLKNYDEVSSKAVTNKVYRFRKEVEDKDNDRAS